MEIYYICCVRLSVRLFVYNKRPYCWTDWANLTWPGYWSQLLQCPKYGHTNQNFKKLTTNFSWYILSSYPLLPYWSTSPSLGTDRQTTHAYNLYNDAQTDNEWEKPYINFKKADWVNFALTSEEEISKLNPPTDVYESEQDFREVINRVSKNTMPQGQIKEIFPEVPTSAKNKILERDELRKTNPQSSHCRFLNSTMG